MSSRIWRAARTRALGVVLVAERRAEHAEHRVADARVDRAAEVLDHTLEERVEDAEGRLGVLGVGLIGAFGEPDQVAEQDRDELAFLSRGHGYEQSATVRTEPRPLRIARPAPRTDQHAQDSGLSRPLTFLGHRWTRVVQILPATLKAVPGAPASLPVTSTPNRNLVRARDR